MELSTLKDADNGRSRHIALSPSMGGRQPRMHLRLNLLEVGCTGITIGRSFSPFPTGNHPNTFTNLSSPCSVF